MKNLTIILMLLVASPAAAKHGTKPSGPCLAGGWTARVALLCPGQMKGMTRQKPYVSSAQSR